MSREPTWIAGPSVINAPGSPPKSIEEYVGRVNSATTGVSIAHMKSPAGWTEPGQRPDFEEYTLVLKGALRVEFEGGMRDVKAGEAVITHPGDWVRYSSPEGAEYIAVCIPAFSPETVHRDSEKG